MLLGEGTAADPGRRAESAGEKLSPSRLRADRLHVRAQSDLFAIQMADPPSSAISYGNPPSRMATYSCEAGTPRHPLRGHTAAGHGAGCDGNGESFSARAKSLGAAPAISQHTRLACEPSVNPARWAASVTGIPSAR